MEIIPLDTEILEQKATGYLLPEDHKYMTFLKKVFRHEFRKNGFRRISTPIVEPKNFLKNIDDNYEQIIHSEDFDFRRNALPGIMKAYIKNNLGVDIKPLYFYYVDRFFEKIDSGIQENNFIGGEVLGEDDPILDAILVYINYTSLNKIGLQDSYKIFIHSTGIEKEKLKYKEALENFYENKKNILSEESKILIHDFPEKILLSTDEDDSILNENAPKFTTKFLKKDSKAHYQKFKEYLDILDVPYQEDAKLIAQDKNQTKSIWEFRSHNGTIITKGSRANAISTNMGEKKEIPASGFASNMEKIISLLKEKNIEIRNKDKIDLFFIQLGDEAKKIVLPLSIQARAAGINTVVSLGTPSMKEQMLKAQKSNAKYVVMVGVMEARNGIFQVRNQEEGTQEEIKKENLIDYIIEKIGTENLDFYSPEKDLVIPKANENI